MDTETTDGYAQYIHGTLFAQTDATIPYIWILLYSPSTVCIFNNPFFLTNTRPAKQHPRVIFDYQWRVPNNDARGRVGEFWNSMVQFPAACQHHFPGGGPQAVKSDHGHGNGKRNFHPSGEWEKDEVCRV